MNDDFTENPQTSLEAKQRLLRIMSAWSPENCPTACLSSEQPVVLARLARSWQLSKRKASSRCC